MSVISITIVESGSSKIADVPATITLSTNIPANIFYTLDGSTPTTSSHIYIAPILIPSGTNDLILSIIATNGIDQSPVIVKNYGPDLTKIRSPRAAVEGLSQVQSNLGPYGSNTVINNGTYQNPADAGVTVNDPTKPQVLTGLYDQNGNPAAQTNEPLENYQIIYSTSDSQGQTGHGIGTLTKVTITGGTPDYTPEISNRSDKVFSPRAMVIFQDAGTENPNDPPMLNRNFFALENPEKVKDGVLLYNTALDSPPTTGSFVRRFVNARDNTVTYYYYDNSVGRWIISKQPVQDKDNVTQNLSSMVFSRDRGVGVVYKWQLFQRRVLF